MVVADGQRRSDPLVEAAELLAHALAERLQRLEPIPRQVGVDADALTSAMVDGHEDTDLALLGGHGRRHVGPPTLVEAIGDDGPIMGLGALGMPDPPSSLQVVLAISRRARSSEVRIP
jgi:hypothetical protein